MTSVVASSEPEDRFSSALNPHQCDERFITPYVRTTESKNTIYLVVRGAKCGGCLAKIERAVADLPGVFKGRLNLSSGKMCVQWRGELTAEEIATTISNLGYETAPYVDEAANAQNREEQRRLLVALGIAGFSMANIMLLSVSVWSGHDEMTDTTRQLMHAISGIIAAPAMVFSGRFFFLSAWRALNNKRVNMDVPVSLALLLAFSVSVVETYVAGPHAYFDACVMLMFFLLLGRFLDARLRQRAFAAAHKLTAMQQRSVRRLGENGVEDVRADEIETGDKLLVAMGERALIDMRLTSHEAEIDESLVTGESVPRTVPSGSTLYSGTINLGPAVQGTALSGAEDSLLSEIESLMEVGAQKRALYLKLADRAVSVYVPFVHMTAFLAFLGWLLAGAQLADAVMIAVSTLIITCPCALALAAPVAQIVAAGRLFNKGVYLNAADGLERLAEVNSIIFDKTGTLTLGQPSWKPTPESRYVLEKAAMLARASRHPLSRAICKASGDGPVASDVIEEPGKGVTGQIAGRTVRLGSAKWIGHEGHSEQSGPVIYLAEEGCEPVAFLFEDVLRSQAPAAIKKLKQMGYRIQILSGDVPHAVSQLAESLGVAEFSSGLSPQAKAEYIEKLSLQGDKILMIGDGVNDAAALTCAHASLAPGSALDLSKSAADAIYTGGLESIVDICCIAKQARSNMTQNFTMAALYNFIAVPIAVAGFASPLVAAIAMSLSSLIVTLNALRQNLLGNQTTCKS